jgi:cytoskeleton protein RodZ
VETLGQDFKHRREERKLSLRDVADATRVGVRFLTAIEADDFAALPGGIYTRSFIRAYAKFLNMDEEEVLARYRKHTAAEEPLEPMMSYKEYPSESSSMSLYVGLLVLLGLIVGGAYGLLHYLDQKNPANNVVNNSSSPTPIASPGTDANPQPTSTSATPAPTPTPIFEQVVLTLKTKQDAWVSVNTDDIEKPLIITIPANSSRDFKADSKLKVTIGNFPAVQVQINGQEAKLPSDNGLIAKALITKENYKEYITTANAPQATPTPKPKTIGAKPPTGTTDGLPTPTTGNTPSASPKPKKTPLPDGETPPPSGSETTIDPTADPTATPTPRIRKPKPLGTLDGFNPAGTTSAPSEANTSTTPKPKVVKPANSGDTTGAISAGTPKPVTPKPKTTPNVGTNTPKPNAGTGQITPPKPKTTPKPVNNTEAKPN